jgi:hypothetical protein
LRISARVTTLLKVIYQAFHRCGGDQRIVDGKNQKPIGPGRGGQAVW